MHIILLSWTCQYYMQISISYVSRVAQYSYSLHTGISFIRGKNIHVIKHADRKIKRNKLQQAQLTELSKNIKNSGLHISNVAHTERLVVLYPCYMLIVAHTRNINILFISWKHIMTGYYDNAYLHFFFINVKVVSNSLH